jgi:putative acetyltransferase
VKIALRLRDASNADRQAIESLVFGVLEQYGLAADPETTDADLKDIEGNYHRKGGAFAVLVNADETVVGSVGLLPISTSTCELRKMYLAPEHRRQGWGKTLLKHALARASELGFSRVML